MAEDPRVLAEIRDRDAHCERHRGGWDWHQSELDRRDLLRLLDEAWFAKALARAEGRREAIEECAKVADGFTCGGCGMDGKASAAIRALAKEN